MHLLRINSSNDIVVPPFECAWLSDENLQLQDEAGCISFKVKGETDAAVIFKATPGSRRWQHIAREGNDENLSAEDNYTIILGSHRNTSLKLEKCGEMRDLVQDAPAFQLSPTEFQQYWIQFDHGCISVGAGVPGSSPAALTWKDPLPTSGMRHIGLAAWDKFVVYRNMRMHNCAAQQVNSQPTSTALPTLEALAKRSIEKSVSVESVSAALMAAHVLEPAADDLADALLSFLIRHLDQVLTEQLEDFLELPLTALTALLESPLLVCPEMKLFRAVILWAQHLQSSCEGKELALSQLLPLVRFPLMSPEELEEVASCPFARLPLLKELIDEALASHAHTNSGPQDLQVQGPRSAIAVESKRHVRSMFADAAAGARFQRRLSPAATELVYIFDGDHNGVCHYLGTKYGQQEFVNPALSGLLQVTASSPTCRSTDPKGVVSGKFMRNNAAGQRPDRAAWWQIDLGAQHSLLCNYYTIRHDASTNYPRNWSLQASTAGDTWVDLQKHVDDRTIKMSGQYASWPVTGHAAGKPFRYFRLLMLGPAGPYNRAFALSNIELYGYFFRSDPAGQPC